MNLSDELVVDLLDSLDRLDERGDHGAAQLRARVLDEVLASMTPPQRRLLALWRGYVCPECGHRMTVHAPEPEAQ